MHSSARLSKDGVYRYWLRRRWDGRVWDFSGADDLWVMLNPSTAGVTVNDPTINRCMGFSRGWGAPGIVVGNLYALRATDPRELKLHPDPIGPDNDAVLAQMTAWTQRHGGRVIVAWGTQLGIETRVRDVLRIVDAPLLCLGTTKSGAPRHPLYVKGDTALQPWRS